MDGPTGTGQRQSRSPRDLLHVLLLMLFDAFAIYEAFAVAFIIRSANPKPLEHPMSAAHFGKVTAALLPVWVVFFGIAGLYAVRQHRARTSEIGRVAVATTCGVMTLVVVDYYLQPLGSRVFPARSVPIYAIPLIIVFVSICRLFARALVRYVQRRGYGLRDVVIVGSGPLAQRLSAVLDDPASGYRIAAVVAAQHDGELLGSGVPVFSNLEVALDKVGPSVDNVMQVDPDIDRADIEHMMSLTTSRGVTYRFVPNQYGVYAAASSMTTIAGVPMMDVRLTSLDGWGAVGKRAFDIVAAASVLILVSPLLLVLALAVKITDPAGPVFYRHPRIGRGGAPIKILKFRSMGWQYSTGPGRPYQTPEEAFRAMGRPDLAAEFAFDNKVHDDPRITRLGHFMRRTSLDELPQLFDVLRGELSLIGPRPITSAELVRYGSQSASYLALKPGVTGLWQVSGRNNVSYEERVKLDIYYSENWSMKLDLSILARTPAAVFARRGAY